MTGVDPMTDQEARLRAELHRTMVAPATPERLRLEVDRLAEAAIDAARSRGGRAAWWPRLGPAIGGLRLGIALAAIVVLAAGSLLLASGLGHRGDVATSSFPPVPTLPAFTGPALPSAPPSGSLIVQGGWIGPTAAWVVDNADRLRVTTDAGQTWSAPRPLPAGADLGVEFLDASTAYTAWSTDAGGGRQAITVYRTADSGRTWSSLPVGSLAWADGEELQLDVHFSDAQHGMVLASSWIYGPSQSGEPAGPASPRECLGWSTSDGGATWSPVGGALCLRRIQWSTPTLGMLWSDKGASVFVTRDGGRSWTGGNLPGVAADDNLYPFVLVETGRGRLRFAMTTLPRDGTVAGAAPLVVVESGDSGATWQEAYRSSAVGALSLSGITALGEDHWMANQELDTSTRPYQESVLLETEDGGRHWAMVGTLGTISGTVQWLDRLHAMAQGVDMGVCSAGGSCGGQGTVFLTNDGGLTWHKVPF